MGVSVIKRVVFGFIALGSVLGISVTELKIKKVRVFKVKLARRLGEICNKSAVIVIARRHHIRYTLDYAAQTLKHSVPLKLVLSVVAVVACGENKTAFGVLCESLSEHIADYGIIGQMARTAILMVGNNKKTEFFCVFSFGFK